MNHPANRGLPSTLARSAAWLLVATVLYVASFGPAVRLFMDGYLPIRALGVYWPIHEITRFESCDPAWNLLDRYIQWCNGNRLCLTPANIEREKSSE